MLAFMPFHRWRCYFWEPKISLNYCEDGCHWGTAAQCWKYGVLTRKIGHESTRTLIHGDGTSKRKLYKTPEGKISNYWISPNPQQFEVIRAWQTLNHQHVLSLYRPCAGFNPRGGAGGHLPPQGFQLPPQEYDTITKCIIPNITYAPTSFYTY